MRYRTLFVAWYLWFLVFSLRVAISPVLPLLEDELSLTHAQAGRLFTILHTGYILILLAAGLIVSRWGSRKTLLAIFGALALLSLALRFSGGAGELEVLLFLLGLATGLLLPAVVPVLTATYSRASWGRTFGVFDTAVGIALFSMPFLAMGVLTFGSWREMFLILSALCWLALGLVFFFIKGDGEALGPGRRVDYRSLLQNRDLLVIGFLFIFMTTASQGIYAIVPTFMVKGRGIDIQLSNTVFGLSRLPAILGAMGGGYMLDRLGPRRTFRIVVTATGLSTIAVAMTPGLVSLTGALFAQTTLSAGFFPASLAFIALVSPEGERSAATGLVIAAGVAVGAGLSPWLLGWLADMWSFEAGIALLGVACTLSAVATGFLREEGS